MKKRDNQFDADTLNFFEKYYSKKTKPVQDDQFDVFLTKYRSNIPRLIIQTIKEYQKTYNISHPKILDFGCGEGDYLFAVGNKLDNTDLIGVDISPSAVRLAKRNRNVGFLYSPDPDIRQLKIVKNNNKYNFFTSIKDNKNLLPSSVDVIYIISVLHHTYDYDNIIHDLSVLLKKNGRLIVFDLKGQGIVVRTIIKLYQKIIPKKISQQIFEKDLLLENGSIPFRSDVTLNKVTNAIQNAGMSIFHVETKTFTPINYTLICFQALYKLTHINFKILEPILRLLFFLDLFFQKAFRNECEVFIVESTKTI